MAMVARPLGFCYCQLIGPLNSFLVGSCHSSGGHGRNLEPRVE